MWGGWTADAKCGDGMNKYSAKKITVDGEEFDSRKEAERYAELKLLERAGVIRDLRRQEEFLLIPKFGKERSAKYHADFSYIDCETGERVVEDVKSKATKTEAYILRRKLMNWVHGIEIREV